MGRNLYRRFFIYLWGNLCTNRYGVSISRMSDIERIIESIIEKRVEPLKKEIEELKKMLGDREGDDEFLTGAEVQKRFKISRTTLWRYCKSNRIKGYVVGESIRYKRSEVESLALPC